MTKPLKLIHNKRELTFILIEKMIPEDDDFFLIKPKHSAFYGTLPSWSKKFDFNRNRRQYMRIKFDK